ncbi:hypothetical protein [Acinetobacter proteolyticus]|uniref:Uncharacterized protein n=1 Tax=Acinetobacter proteolyticus TaxID=1776741 RepID=A0A2N0WIC3_9GAMM|nr:hypothetical protein [Acinetobacter proteolyticus]PKF35565.1 hypothetical protein CW311_04560 [Acinetobacter proteolyticus]
MTKKIDIGASISSRKDASSTVESIFNVNEFPCTLTIENHTVTRLILPELKALDIKGMGSKDAHFSDIGLLKRVVSSLAQISRLNGFECMATVRIPSIAEEAKPQDLETDSQNQTAETQNPINDVSTEITAIIVEENGNVLLVEANGYQFEIKKNSIT